MRFAFVSGTFELHQRLSALHMDWGDHSFTMAKTTLTDDVRSLDTETLLDVRTLIDEVLEQRRKLIERQLQQLNGRPRSVGPSIEPRYRSRRDPEKVWTGRGQLPRWMREEMEGTKLTKEDFRIRER
jgi:DNA-binding protein H-NS